jgi:hypothetical protein
VRADVEQRQKYMVVLFSALGKDGKLKVVFTWKDFFIDKCPPFSKYSNKTCKVQKAGLFIFAGLNNDSYSPPKRKIFYKQSMSCFPRYKHYTYISKICDK